MAAPILKTKPTPDFRAVCSVIGVMASLSYKEFLTAAYQKIKDQDPDYSYTKFADQLGFSATNVLWLVATGRRKLTSLTSKRLADGLELEGIQRQYFLLLVKYNNARDPVQREIIFRKMTLLKANEVGGTAQDDLEYCPSWRHAVIRELVTMHDFEPTPTWISAKIYANVLPAEVRETMDVLTRMGLITFDANAGRFVKTGLDIKPDRRLTRVAAVRYHQKMIEIAKEALTQVPSTAREYDALTVSIPVSKIDEIRKIIISACEQIEAIEKGTQDADAVVQVNMQMFPFTKIRKE